mgnify:CR=1 FL=1
MHWPRFGIKSAGKPGNGDGGKHVCSLEVHLRNARGPDEKAAGARDKGNTPEIGAAPDFEGFQAGCD